MNAILLWALPSTWCQFELLDHDLGERIDAEMRERFRGTDLCEDDLERLIATQLQALSAAAENGIALLATRPEQAMMPEGPPSGLSLTLALANRPGRDNAADDASQPQVRVSSPARAVHDGLSAAHPLVLEDAQMDAFSQESRAEVPVSGVTKPLTRFQVQVFVLPKGQVGMAVVTVTTFDPRREDEAREAARSFANTLRFVTAPDGEPDDFRRDGPT
jgi:hypothetical protein